MILSVPQGQSPIAGFTKYSCTAVLTRFRLTARRVITEPLVRLESLSIYLSCTLCTFAPHHFGNPWGNFNFPAKKECFPKSLGMQSRAVHYTVNYRQEKTQVPLISSRKCLRDYVVSSVTRLSLLKQELSSC